MRIALDTTVLVRASVSPLGSARELLFAILEGRHTLLLSNEMLHEFETWNRHSERQRESPTPSPVFTDESILTVPPTLPVAGRGRFENASRQHRGVGSWGSFAGAQDDTC